MTASLPTERLREILAAAEKATPAWSDDRRVARCILEDAGALDPTTIAALVTEVLARREADQWQPIETAPKDGTRVDLWRQGHRVTDAFWDKVEEWWCIDSRYSDGEPCPLAVSPEPTHWRPLHTPPALGATNVP